VTDFVMAARCHPQRTDLSDPDGDPAVVTLRVMVRLF
jgi:hypothetical protein